MLGWSTPAFDNVCEEPFFLLSSRACIVERKLEDVIDMAYNLRV